MKYHLNSENFILFQFKIKTGFFSFFDQTIIFLPFTKLLLDLISYFLHESQYKNIIIIKQNKIFENKIVEFIFEIFVQ